MHPSFPTATILADTTLDAANHLTRPRRLSSMTRVTDPEVEADVITRGDRKESSNTVLMPVTAKVDPEFLALYDTCFN